MIRLLGFLTLFLLTALSLAQPVLGDWDGVIGPDDFNLGVIIHFEEGADGVTGTADIPAQVAVGLPLRMLELGETSVRFALDGVTGEPTFEGELVDADLILGTYTQNGEALPFRLDRRVAVPEEPPLIRAYLDTWRGVIGPDSLGLEVAVTFEELDGKFVGRIQIPAQNFASLLDVRGVTEETISFVIEGVRGNATFEATRAQDKLQGLFTQNGQSHPFTLSRGE